MKSDIIDKVVAEFGTFTILVHRFLKDITNKPLSQNEHIAFMSLTSHIENNTLPLLEELVKNRQEPDDLTEKVKQLEERVAHLELTKKSW